MAKVNFLVGSTLGNSEYVADEMAAHLEEQGHETKILLSPELNELIQSQYLILVCSTHGAGDPPDNIVPIMETIESEKPDFASLKIAVCAIGDSSYDTFCLGAKKVETALLTAGAIEVVDKIEIDVQQEPVPEEPALAWLTDWQDRIN